VVLLVALLTVLSVAASILVMVTSFTRIVVVAILCGERPVVDLEPTTLPLLALGGEGIIPSQSYR
jgi:flagellar biosynthesis protein FliP